MTLPHEQQNRTFTVVGVALALFLGALDQTIVSTAMPRIVADLGGLDRYTWVSTVYLLVSTLLVPLYGKLSDMMSRKTLELISILVFLVGSALCGMAGEWGTLPGLGDGMSQLIVFRGIQGLGGAGLFALAFIVISDLYPPRERGKVGGVFGAVFGLSSVLGPLIGGILTDQAGSWLPPVEGWRWVFYVNLPIGAVALWFIFTRMPRLQPQGQSHQLDLVSAGLMVLAFFPLILGLQLDKTQHPWTSVEVLILLGGGGLGLAGWIAHSLWVSHHPILDLRLFSNSVFTTGVIASFFFGSAFLSILIFLPLYMVNVQGVSATAAGASIIPLTLGIVFGSGLGGPLADRWGRYKAILLVGAAVTLTGGFLMTTFSVQTPLWVVLLAMVVTGVGFGPAQSLYAVAIQNAVPVHELGQATSFSQFSRQVGSAVGVALAGALFSAAVTAAFSGGLGSDLTAATRSVNMQDRSQGPQEIRTRITGDFDRLIARTETLLELTGAEAKQALARFQSDPLVPQKLKDKLSRGTPAMQIEESLASLYERLESIVVKGDKTALEALLQSQQAEVLPDASRDGLRVLVAKNPSDRQAALPDLRAQMESGRQRAVASSNFIALAVIKAELRKAQTAVIDQTIGYVSGHYAQALYPVWWFNTILLVLLLVSTAFVPGLPLRGKGQSVPETPDAG